METQQFLYPLKFTPILKERIWGGHKLSDILNKKPMDRCGESWEVSGVPGDISVVANGFLKNNNLQELIEVYMGDLVGDSIYDRFGLEFPVLIKFIDAQDDLSIQVHPNDQLAAERHHSYGKTEMWYVMDAEKDSHLIVGFNRDTDKIQYEQSLKNKTLSNILNFEPVTQGDVFFIPAGRIHAIGKGILLAEIQQTSDITYRIYDWDRVDKNGKSRELHTELALDAIDYKAQKEYKTLYQKAEQGTAEVVKCPYFTTNLVSFSKTIEKDFNHLDSFIIYICTSGSCEIRHEHGTVHVSEGETVLIPAVVKNFSLATTEPTELLEVYIE